MSTQGGLNDMAEARKALEGHGHTVIMPHAEELSDYTQKTPDEVKKLKNFFIWEHFGKIEDCDAILVTNGEKKGIQGYIGANTFLEMGIAMYLKKKIFLVNPISPEVRGYEEILGMLPVVLNGKIEDIA
jgi:diphthamide synthase subunit DPH2